MTHTDGHLPSGLYCRTWAPDGAALAPVVLVHGLAEHIGRYEHVAAALNAAGFLVAGLDHLGHGQSPGPRLRIDRFDDYVDGVFELIDAQFASEPVHLVGHSMGGLIALHCALRKPERLRSLVLSGPAIVADPPPPGWQQFVVRLLSRIAPGAGVVALDGTAVSRDASVVQRYFDDPLVYNGKVPARLAAALFAAMGEAVERARELSLPLLALHGTADRLTSPEGSKLIHEQAASVDKTLRLYPDLYHEVFNEPERDAVLAELTDWLAARSA